MKSICFIAQFPPPIHGLSKAVETLYQSPLQDKYRFKKIDITDNTSILKNILKVLFSNCELYYLTIAQTRGGNWRDLFFLKLLKIKKKKCIVHLHGGYYRKLIDEDCSPLQKKLNYKAIPKVDACIVLGKSLVSIFDGIIDTQKIHIAPNCVDDEFMISSELVQKKLDLLSVQKRIHILYLSNFIETKGYKEVLALALLAKKKGNEDMHFHFAGKFFNADDENIFKSYIVKNDLREIVNYHGIVTGQSKIDLLQLCNVFVLLSRYPNEGQPISILEAMGNGMTIITTNHAGIPDIVNMNENGLVVDKDKIDVELIYKYICYCRDNPDFLRNIAGTNYQTIKENYSETRYVANIDGIFKTVLKE